MPAKDRLQYFDFSTVWRRREADGLCYILRKDGVLRQEDVSELQREGISLLSLVAFSYMAFTDTYTNEYSKWRKLCRKLVGMTHDISFKQVHTELDLYHMPWTPSATPLAMLIMQDQWPIYCVSMLRSALNSKLRDWLEDLQACGVDLQNYGLVEKRIFLENGWFGKRWYPYRQYEHVQVRLISFDSGATPEDWIFDWDMDAERHAGKFWESIENPKPQIPGAWIDDDSCCESYSSDEEDW
ncbi:hypothetical protein B0O99DRAFT_610897 [Bisporella sp. PMI_857]|nr:hypothetical protein B0O99DRAFT_612310 [Bisporella sp. PMI_857]KAH8600541.1 hypothetical protein B0O99DRAFT_610897 [Bisporella sp. PMI_857]